MLFITLISVKTLPKRNDSKKLDTCLKQIADNDICALSELYYATHESIYAYALSVLKNTHDAEDVLQDCYIRISNSAHLYSSQGKPLAWMISITRNLCMELLRRRKQTSDIPQEDWETYINGYEGISKDDHLILKECMLSLSDEERQIVILHAVAGFKHREISSVLHLPLSTVLSKYNRAVKKLKNELERS